MSGSSAMALKQQKPVGRDDPARRLAVGKGKQLPASGTPSGRALQKYVSFTVIMSMTEYFRFRAQEAFRHTFPSLT